MLSLRKDIFTLDLNSVIKYEVFAFMSDVINEHNVFQLLKVPIKPVGSYVEIKVCIHVLGNLYKVLHDFYIKKLN